MKIGILTLPLHTNYGGILQAYALQTVLERMGHEVVVIDDPKRLKLPFWKWPLSYPKRVIVKYLLGREVTILNEKQFNQTYPIISHNIQQFVDKYIHRIEVENISSLQEKDFDAIVVGSDQIWRPRYYSKIENAYLKFAKKWQIKRIAYAASFGTDSWEYTPQQSQKCKKLLKHFDAVSVREISGITLCKNHLAANATHVLDPTMLLKKEDYIKLFEASNTPPSKGTLLSYILDKTSPKIALIEKIAEQKKLITFCVNAKREDWKAPLEDCIQPPIEQWLRGFYDAEYIVTDSFHACVFAILFGKPFLVIGNESRGLSRFKTLLSICGQEDRLIEETGDFDLEKLLSERQTTDYPWEDMRQKSYNYLLNSIGQ